MNDAKRLGKNIRYFRELYKESQEELALFLNISKQAVSSYELGNTSPTLEKIFKIAEHYLITADELMYTDCSKELSLTGVDNEIAIMDKETLFVLFPIYGSGKIGDDEHFMRAFKMHEDFYTSLTNKTLTQSLDNCFIEYFQALDNELVRNETMANVVAIWHLLMFTAKNGKEALMGMTALVQKLAKEYNTIRKKIIYGPSQQLESNLKSLLEVLTDPLMVESIDKFMVHLKKDSNWSSTADYYFALQYALNIIDSGLSPDLNRTVGAEMINVLFKTQNPLVCDMLRLVLKSFSFPQKSTET